MAKEWKKWMIKKTEKIRIVAQEELNEVLSYPLSKNIPRVNQRKKIYKKNILIKKLAML